MENNGPLRDGQKLTQKEANYMTIYSNSAPEFQEPDDPDDASNLYILSDFRPVSDFVRVDGKLQPKPAENDNAADPPDKPAAKPSLRVLDWDEWASMTVPPREHLIAPIIKQKTLNELYAPRGLGKTWLAMGIAIAVATGTNFLRWSVSKPYRVLYVDGEMAFEDLQVRAKAMVAAQPVPPQLGILRLLAADIQDRGIPDLAAEDSGGREEVNAALRLGTPEQVDLLILDNISTLTATGSENSDEAWAKMQDWLLSLKRRGVSVMFIHHAGKNGKQRGTSKREDPLDTVINLRKPKDWKAEDGARFEIHFEKNRGFRGADALPFEAQFVDGKWVTNSLSKESLMQQAAAMADRGMSVREIAAAMNISKTEVGRLLQKARALSGIDEPLVGAEE